MPAPDREPWAPDGLRKTVLGPAARGPGDGGRGRRCVDAVEAARTPETVLVCDMAVAGYWVGGYAGAPAPRRLAYPVGWGTLGFALPAAVGAAATGRPVLAVCGDGGLMMGLGELATLVQHRLPVTVLVVDDGGYGMLRYDQARAGHPPAGVDLATPDFPALAAAFGLPATDVGAVAGLAPALAAALGERRAAPGAAARPADAPAHHVPALARGLTPAEMSGAPGALRHLRDQGLHPHCRDIS